MATTTPELIETTEQEVELEAVKRNRLRKELHSWSKEGIEIVARSPLLQRSISPAIQAPPLAATVRLATVRARVRAGRFKLFGVLHKSSAVVESAAWTMPSPFTHFLWLHVHLW